MSEYERWSKISPLSERFVRYASYYNFGRTQKLRLADVTTKDLEGREYFNLSVDLALKGYKLELVEGLSKSKIGVGLDRLRMYSYFELVPGELLAKLEQIQRENNERERKIAENYINLENEYAAVKDRKKAGQKELDDRETIMYIFNAYLSNQSMLDIMKHLNSSGIKTKRSGKWHKSTISLILSNHRYFEMGYVSEKEFNEVQEIAKRNRRNKAVALE